MKELNWKLIIIMIVIFITGFFVGHLNAYREFTCVDFTGFSDNNELWCVKDQK